MKYAFPDNYGEDCILLILDKSLVPMVSGALKPFEQHYSWFTTEDYEQGYNAFAELQAAMTGSCISDLIESNNRIYRLLDTAFNGATYTATPDPVDPELPPTITPELPAVPLNTNPALLTDNALRKRFERLVNLTDNLITGQTYGYDPVDISAGELTNDMGLRERVQAMQGTINAGWFGIGGQEATLADLVGALRIGSEGQKEAVLSTLDSILNSGGSAASIVNLVAGLFGDTVDAAGDGAILATLIASTLGNAAMLGTMAGQIDRLIASLDGGGLTRPGDNVLLALRGTTEASAERNVLDGLGGTLVELVDDVEGLLTDIKAAVQ